MTRYFVIPVTFFLEVLLCNSVHAGKPNFGIILTDDQGPDSNIVFWLPDLPLKRRTEPKIVPFPFDASHALNDYYFAAIQKVERFLTKKLKIQVSVIIQ